jgi:hypothetical protein
VQGRIVENIWPNVAEENYLKKSKVPKEAIQP